jgi:hypoxanthine phosphoribosyltransferase
MFLADLTRELSLLGVTHVVDFMAVSSYGKTVSSGEVRIVMDLREPIQGQHVLIIEDIVDTGNTINYLYRILEGRKPASMRTAALVRKENKGQDIDLSYLGFEIPDVWVVGYGLDYAEMYRTLPFVAELKSEVYS